MTEPIKEPTEPGEYWLRTASGSVAIEREADGWRHFDLVDNAHPWDVIVRHFKPIAIEPVARPSWEQVEDLNLNLKWVREAREAYEMDVAARRTQIPVPAHPSGPQGADISPERKAALESMQRFLDKREEHQAIMARWFDLVRRDPERVLQTMLRDLGPLNDALAESRRKDDDER